MNYVYLLLSILLQSVAAICSKYASVELNNNNILELIFNGFYLLSLLCLALQAYFWQLTLRKIDLSIAFPFTALNNIFILIFSFFIFKETISLNNVFGVIIIMFGIILLSTQSEKL